MNWVRQMHVGWLCAFLPLLFLCSNGCTTAQPGAATNKNLEKYRKVYVPRPKGGEDHVTAGVFSRLKAAGFDAVEVDEENLKKIIAAKEAKEPTLVCDFDSISTYDYARAWQCFNSIHIRFYDLENEQLVFKVGYFNRESIVPESTELNRLFREICDNFFPGQPNPFRGNLKGPFGPTYHRFYSEP
jgi:hypothetical protein